MVLDELSAGIPGSRLHSRRPAGGATEITGIVYRADRAAPGAMFACLRGARADGHDFAAAAACFRDTDVARKG